MSEIYNMIKDCRLYRNKVQINSQEYVNSRSVVNYNKNDQDINYDIKDILFLCALSGTDCLMTGKTGAGKTHLSSLAMQALFGDEHRENKTEIDDNNESRYMEGYVNKTITPSMRPQEFLDISYKLFIESGESLKGAMEKTPILQVPGVILNEANRAPGFVQNFLIPFLDKKMDIEGKYVDVGVDNGVQNYQFRTITINEGEEYETTAMDKALRDRVGLEIPMDGFYQSSSDCLEMLKKMAKSKSDKDNDVNLEEPSMSMPELSGKIEGLVKKNREVSFLLLYLSGMSYCYKVAQYNVWPPVKELIQLNEAFCSDCRYAAATELNSEHNICGSVRALSQRALRQLLRLSQAVCVGAMIQESRLNKTSEFVVQEEDVWAIAPLVLYKKLQLSQRWLNAHAGSEWIALLSAIELIRKRWEKIKEKNILEHAMKADEGQALNEKVMREIRDYVSRQTDYWVLRLFPTYRAETLRIRE
ncbi:hypothetical protein Dthio_PD2129 [Desulfonatronospira thiodismutans ASO3-1]|uniref:ATPase associated with various cellular activities AAA_5 n=1 Tax=Desulfonatronospira thiodismutans ASO3-1 TaxID=555779 RepID=D6SPS7_9BACT|nr:hypothetical protein [Desulfonatronospira thiodismutans]EFI34753.1 hypothetical protein Dthio_PD2129 [Desulfonatronospira thiodismutans ASO3-1]